MTGRRSTVMDIAKACGVSRATVSLVLRDSPLVAADTRQRVRAEIERQGYVYNRTAANLRRRTSNSVALVLNDLSNPYFAEFASGVDEALGGAGYVTLLGSTGESTHRQAKVIATLMEHDPAGIILSPAEHSGSNQLQALIGRSTPMLVFNRALSGAHWDFLRLDNHRGARLAAEHLIGLGHRRIAFYGGHADSSSCHERRRGYADAMRHAGLIPEAHWLIETAPTRIDAAAHAARLFAREPQPTAALCYNDAVALGLMLGLSSHGRQAGKDFAVTGFDDIPESAVSMPPLTTLATGPRARGQQAAERLLQRIAEPTLPEVNLVAAVELVVRASTCPPPRP